MVAVLLFSCVVTIAGTMASIEDRNRYLWGFGAGGTALALIHGLDVFSLFAYVLALVGTFLALWIAKAIDDKRAGRPF